MANERFTLKKTEILSKRDELNLLFKEGKSFNEFPFKVIHRRATAQDDEVLQFAVSIPKRIFKKAVDRTHLKRRCKEAYRLHRNELKNNLKDENLQLHFMLIYVSREALNYQIIEQKIILTLQRLQGIYAKNSQ